MRETEHLALQGVKQPRHGLYERFARKSEGQRGISLRGSTLQHCSSKGLFGEGGEHTDVLLRLWSWGRVMFLLAERAFPADVWIYLTWTPSAPTIFLKRL